MKIPCFSLASTARIFAPTSTGEPCLFFDFSSRRCRSAIELLEARVNTTGSYFDFQQLYTNEVWKKKSELSTRDMILLIL